ncbi:hypothetical protein SAMN05443543_109136 [Flavobacterium flevense]|uniref:Uncharacterized protein n=1 Tax=Flavobacterium flevense TaxID=983 RepID=A0A4Y4AXF1_9FLAO|nr:hypothetical protein [Flavobacterium flevense]GEC71264.1 hypothetical protein FFL01_08030 [Flavobacterium flevense]SHM05065.1 hypothetical protein SAMN05443543_109136 [Flavobacterium flevense]
MKKLILLPLLLICVNTFSQTKSKKDTFTLLVTKVLGDLNKDNLEDKVVVTQDTINENAPYKLQIFFAQPNGQFKLIATSTKIIAPQYPNGRDGYRTGDGFLDVTIIKGIVSVNFGLLRGHFEHKFRFQNGNFELIGFSSVSSDGQGKMYTTDFNLSTGIRIEKIENYGEDDDGVSSNIKKKILLRPLPKIQDVEPYENELY